MTSGRDTIELPGTPPGGPAGVLASRRDEAPAGPHHMQTCLHCPAPIFTADVCNVHYQRRLSGFPMDAPVRVYNKTVRTYKGAHSRIRRILGSASLYRCVSCAETARDWAYNHGDPNEIVDTTEHYAGMLFSTDPDYYQPMCKRCHRELDSPTHDDGPKDW